MIVNSEVKRAIENISRESVIYANQPDKHRQYMIRLLRYYDSLPQDDRVYYLKHVLSNMVINSKVNSKEFHAQIIKAQRFNILMVVISSSLITLGVLDIWMESGNINNLLLWIKELLILSL